MISDYRGLVQLRSGTQCKRQRCNHRVTRAGNVRNAAPELSGIFLKENDIAPLAAFLRALNEDYD